MRRVLRIFTKINAQRVVAMGLAVFILAAPQIASAQNTGYGDLTPKQMEKLGIYFAKGNYSCGTSAAVSTSTTSDPSTNQGTWNSGLQPPYILEQYMIETLKDIAQKKHTTAQNTVTQEHVIALVAFAIGEGGDINNQDLFNPLNSGINAPDLVDGSHADNGVQSFKSFDAGVEATARSMTGTTQGRLGDILVQPNSTAQQFMEALTYYQRYPNNKFWAEASTPDQNAKPPAKPQDRQDNYYAKRLDYVRQVSTNYGDNAGLVIGTAELEFQTHKTVTAKLQFHPVSSNSAGTASTATTTADGQSCACTNTGTQPVIVLDPGHSGDSKTVIDPATNLKDFDYPNHPEMEDVFDVAQRAQTQLQADGYRVILTKTTATDTVTFRERANLANDNKAALAVSIHDQAGTTGGLPFASANNHVYIQKNGLYRVNEKGDKVAFNNAAVAALSAKYGDIFIAQRTTAEGHKVDLDQADLSGRAGLADGNIWMVQLFSNVPWIYNEVGGVSSGGTGARAGGLSNEDKQKYANGIIAGVEKSVPVTKTATGDCSGSGNWTATLKAYAWPTYRESPYYQMTDATSNDKSVPCLDVDGKKVCYRQAVDAAQARIRAGKNDYVGGGENPGIDCGGFVTRLFRDSKADPQYNSATSNVVAQHQYLAGHPEKYRELKGSDHPTKPSDLRKGDIFIEAHDEHTYVFVGDGIWKGYNAASASIGPASWRTPMASHAYDISQSTWYRPLFPID